MPRENRTRFVAQAAVIAGLYVAITFAFQPISFGPVQLRVSEALCVLVAFSFSAVPGLFVGCLLANLVAVALGISIPIDVIVGSLSTLAAAALGYALRKRFWLLPLPAVCINAVAVGTMLHYVYMPEISVLWNILYVGAGQVLACYGLGLPLYFGLRRVGLARWGFTA